MLEEISPHVLNSLSTNSYTKNSVNIPSSFFLSGQNDFQNTLLRFLAQNSDASCSSNMKLWGEESNGRLMKVSEISSGLILGVFFVKAEALTLGYLFCH